MLKTIFINLAKFSVTSGLLIWLFKSGKLDFKLLANLTHQPFTIILAVGLSLINFFLISYRWKSILKARSQIDIPVLGLLKINWIGQFFSSVLPGSVTGDLIKIIYVQKFENHFSKKFLFASILIDRAMGLAGLILLVGFCSIIFSGHILQSAPGMAPLLKFNHILVIIVILAVVLFLYWHHHIRNILLAIQKAFFPNLMGQIINLWDDLVLIRSKIVRAIGLSVIVQFIGVLIFWSLISTFVDGKMDFIQAVAFLPLGLMALALPIAPSGLGVGHAIFQSLFEFSGIHNGASLFNIYFVVSLSVNLIGAIPYLLSKRK